MIKAYIEVFVFFTILPYLCLWDAVNGLKNKTFFKKNSLSWAHELLVFCSIISGIVQALVFTAIYFIFFK